MCLTICVYVREREQNTDGDPPRAREHLLKQQFLTHLLLLNFATFLLTPQSSLFKCFPLLWHTLDLLLL